MMSYCTITSNRQTLGRLHMAGWGLFITPGALARNGPAWDWSMGLDPPMSYAIDNGAWGAHTQGIPWESVPFMSMLVRHGAGSDFVVVPDIVEGGAASLRRSLEWLKTCLSHSRLALIPVQDGMEPDDVAGVLSERVGVFVGGSTEYKEATLARWAAVSSRAGAWCHVGRVNSCRRLKMCTTAGVDSVDGTSVCRFPSTLDKLDGARRQMSLGGLFE